MRRQNRLFFGSGVIGAENELCFEIPIRRASWKIFFGTTVSVCTHVTSFYSSALSCRSMSDKPLYRFSSELFSPMNKNFIYRKCEPLITGDRTRLFYAEHYGLFQCGEIWKAIIGNDRFLMSKFRRCDRWAILGPLLCWTKFIFSHTIITRKTR